MSDQNTLPTQADERPSGTATPEPLCEPKADEYLGTATYSPDDNKLRFYPRSRLSKEDYERAKAAGFRWAPKQELFFAPAWTPSREDLLLEWCGEIEDEDKTLTERAEERAERFEGYGEKRAKDADRAQAAVRAIAENIPFGQPILVGHHSERHARKDAERIRSGMDRAVKMWKTSKYWESRAAGAIHHAKYKELPRVRANRIKKLEAEMRVRQRSKADSEDGLAYWTADGLTLAQARILADVYSLQVEQKPGQSWPTRAYDVLRDDPPQWPVERVQDVARRVYPRSIAYQNRWIEHYESRLTYERAMLADQGATHLLDKKPRPALLPLLNYRAPGGIGVTNKYRREEVNYLPQIEMTAAEWAKINVDYKGADTVDGTHRVRVTIQKSCRVCVYITDSKDHGQPPAKPDPQHPAAKIQDPAPAPIAATREPKPVDPRDDLFQGMAESLRQGVRVVSAPQLFPTPPEIAAKMVEYANIEEGHDILEPSAGTGRIIDAIIAKHGPRHIVAIEINDSLAGALHDKHGSGAPSVYRTDFLEWQRALRFDRIIMNPPFENGADIKHIKEAIIYLKPGGRLVALCANGPRQREALQPMASHWEQLPQGSFASEGTGVNVAILVIQN